MFKCPSQYKVSKNGKNCTNEVNSHGKNGKQETINN